jgi:DNA-binding MarR family transcriptional regulator
MEDYIKIKVSVVKNDKISLGAKMLYGILNNINEGGDKIISNKELAEFCSVTRRSVVGWIKELKEAGLVDVIVDYDTRCSRRITIKD